MKNKYLHEEKELINQLLSSLNETKKLGKMLDIEMEEGNFRAENYIELAKLINQAINSIEAIKEKI